MKWAWLFLLSACSVPALDAGGKHCTGSCPDGWACQGQVCVPEGSRYCDSASSSLYRCLDFEPPQGLSLDAGWFINRGLTRIAVQLDEDGGNLHNEIADGGNGPQGRLELPLPDFQKVTLRFDLNARLDLQPGIVFVAVSEILCSASPNFSGAWLHYRDQGAGAAFVLSRDGDHHSRLDPQPVAQEWTRITLIAVNGDDGFVSAQVGDAQPVTAPLLKCLGTWSLNVGLAPVGNGNPGALQARFDNVSVELTPP